jgi:hypothetical protein
MALPKTNKTRTFNRHVTREALLAAEEEGWEPGEEEAAPKAELTDLETEQRQS